MRVTVDEVKAVVSTALADPIVNLWIGNANSVINSHADCIGGDEALLTQVELMLAAHFVGMLDPSIRGFVTKESIDGFDLNYSNPVSMKNNIDNTPYGTTANMLSKGCLASSSDKVASVNFL